MSVEGIDLSAIIIVEAFVWIIDSLGVFTEFSVVQIIVLFFLNMPKEVIMVTFHGVIEIDKQDVISHKSAGDEWVRLVVQGFGRGINVEHIIEVDVIILNLLVIPMFSAIYLFSLGLDFWSAKGSQMECTIIKVHNGESSARYILLNQIGRAHV